MLAEAAAILPACPGEAPAAVARTYRDEQATQRRQDAPAQIGAATRPLRMASYYEMARDRRLLARPMGVSALHCVGYGGSTRWCTRLRPGGPGDKEATERGECQDENDRTDGPP